MQGGDFLRAASFDSPAEGLSAFAMEMLDTATILRDATSKTLVSERNGGEKGRRRRRGGEGRGEARREEERSMLEGVCS